MVDLNPVTRLYANAQQAADAVAQLKAAGFDADSITVVGPGASVESLTTAIMAANVLKHDAKVFAAGVAQGRTLVSTQYDFGRGIEAMQILDACSPVDSGVSDFSEPAPGYNEGTPFSIGFGLPLLAKSSTTWFGLRPLSRTGKTISERLGLPLLSRGTLLYKGRSR